MIAALPGLLTGALILAGCTSLSKPAEPATLQKATIVLADGRTLQGKIRSQTDEAIGFLSDQGQFRSIPVKDVLFVKTENGQGETTSAAMPPAPAPTRPGALEKFQPPASGVLAIPSGATISVTPNQTIDSAAVFPHQMLTGELTEDIAAKPVKIPAGANATLELIDTPLHDAAKMVFGITGVNINGHLYRVAAGKVMRLGTVAASAITAVPGATEKARRISSGTVLNWKLAQPLVLKESK
jgi:hypothetical protein